MCVGRALNVISPVAAALGPKGLLSPAYALFSKRKRDGQRPTLSGTTDGTFPDPGAPMSMRGQG